MHAVEHSVPVLPAWVGSQLFVWRLNTPVAATSLSSRGWSARPAVTQRKRFHWWLCLESRSASIVRYLGEARLRALCNQLTRLASERSPLFFSMSLYILSCSTGPLEFMKRECLQQAPWEGGSLCKHWVRLYLLTNQLTDWVMVFARGGNQYLPIFWVTMRYIKNLLQFLRFAIQLFCFSSPLATW